MSKELLSPWVICTGRKFVLENYHPTTQIRHRLPTLLPASSMVAGEPICVSGARLQHRQIRLTSMCLAWL